MERDFVGKCKNKIWKKTIKEEHTRIRTVLCWRLLEPHRLLCRCYSDVTQSLSESKIGFWTNIKGIVFLSVSMPMLANRMLSI